MDHPTWARSYTPPSGRPGWPETPLSAADVALYPALKSLERAGTKPGASDFDLRVLPLNERYPAISGWATRIEQIPGYDRTFPPHWRRRVAMLTATPRPPSPPSQITSPPKELLAKFASRLSQPA